MATDFTFAYGSNMNRSELRSWLEANGYDSSLIVDASPATLEGYDFVWNYYSQARSGGFRQSRTQGEFCHPRIADRV